MSIFKIPARQNTESKNTSDASSDVESSSLGNSDLGNSDVEISTVADSKLGNSNVENNENNKNKTKTIVLDGPLSTIYTKALNIVYSNSPDSPDESISQESQAIDYTVLTYDENRDADKDIDLYVYVTDSEKLESDGVDKIFNKLRLALDKNKKNMVAIETGKYFSNKQAILEDYLFKNNVKVYHSRDIALEKIKLAVSEL